MFFGSRNSSQVKGQTSEVKKAVSTPRKVLMAVALSAAIAAPVGVVKLVAVLGLDSAAIAQDTQLTNEQKLKAARDQYDAKQYEEALATLQQVDSAALADADKKTYAELLRDVDGAATERKAARAQFALGEEALKSGKFAEAVGYYKAAAGNKFVDEGTKNKAMEQIALAEAGMGNEGIKPKDLYKAAEGDYKAARYADAKTKFQQLQAMGYKGGLFDKSPGEYLKLIDRQMAAPAPADNTASTPAKTPADEAANAQQSAAKAAYQAGRQQFKANDFTSARANFKKAIELGYKPGLFEDSAQSYLKSMDEKEQADAVKALRAAERERDDKQKAELAAKLKADREAAEAKAKADRDAADRARAALAQANPPTTPETPKTPTTPETPATPATPATPVDNRTAAQRAVDQAAVLERVVKERQAFEAKTLVEVARRAESEGRYPDALSLYGQAVRLDPNNGEALAGRQKMEQITNTSPTRTPTEVDFVRERNIQRGVLEYQFKQAMGRFDEAVQMAVRSRDTNAFTVADAALATARAARDQRPDLFNQQQMQEMDTTITQAQLRLDRTREQVARQVQDETTKGTEAAIRDRENRAKEELRTTVAALIRDAQREIQQTKYENAMRILDHILAVDPTNDYAKGVKPLVKDKFVLQRQRKFREDFDHNLERLLVEAEEKRIPYDDIYRYPENWPELSARRDQMVERERSGGAEDAQARAQLEKILPELRFDAIAFTDVVDFLRDVSGANIFVNWTAIEASGIQKTQPVTARLRNVKFAKALKTILSDVGGGEGKLGYTIDEGVITISTTEELSKNTVTRVYDIRDLLVDIPNFTNAPDFNLSTSGTATGTNGSGLSFGSNGSGSGTDEDEETTSTAERIDNILQLIQDTVAPDSWRDKGGQIGSIRELNGQMIVTQTSENHTALMGLLDQLREARAIQVTVETRFLAVRRNFFEDVGLDFDFAFNINNPNRYSPISVNNDSASFTAGPITAVPGSLGGSVTGLTTAVTFLDDFQVNLLLRATQASEMNSLVTAPRVTLFNGQRAFLVVATQQAYVSNITAVVGGNVLGGTPQISVLNSGVVLDVAATVSADRKYVTLTLRPQLSVAELKTFAFQQPGGGSGVNGANGSASGALVQVIQTPVVQLTDVRTTVTVPDGGTLLLGGQTLAGEVEREAGVPVLSKIPFLKRLFTNRSMAKDEQILLILVKPTIIITREQEEDQFPIFSQKKS